MARRSAVRHGPRTAAYDDVDATAGLVTRTDDPAGAWDVAGNRRTRRGWRGSGGRWWIWVGRVILWSCLIVVLVNGIRAPFERFTTDPAAPSAPGQDAKVQYPASAASAYALQFANVYLNYDQQNPAVREQQLQYFLPDGAEGQFGWNGAGEMHLQSVQVAGVDTRDTRNGVVTLLAQANGKLLQLAVPVYADGGRLVISGRPALLPPPARAELPQQNGEERDGQLEAELQQALVGFFKAYGSGDTVALSRFSDRNSITGLTGAVTFGRLTEVIAPSGPATERTVTTTVVWQVPSAKPKGTPGELEQTYELTVVKKDGTWYVSDIRGSTKLSGS